MSHHEDSSIVRWGWRQVDLMAMQIITDNSDKVRWTNKGYKYIPILLLELRLVVVYSFSRLFITVVVAWLYVPSSLTRLGLPSICSPLNTCFSYHYIFIVNFYELHQSPP